MGLHELGHREQREVDQLCHVRGRPHWNEQLAVVDVRRDAPNLLACCDPCAIFFLGLGQREVRELDEADAALIVIPIYSLVDGSRGQHHLPWERLHRELHRLFGGLSHANRSGVCLEHPHLPQLATVRLSSCQLRPFRPDRGRLLRLILSRGGAKNSPWRGCSGLRPTC